MIVNEEKIKNYNKEINHTKKNDEDKSIEDEDNEMNSTCSQTVSNLFSEESNNNKSKNKNHKKNKKNKTSLMGEFKEQIEKMIDKQFEEEYIKINKDYDEKIEELLNEQELIYNKNEIIKAKYYALEKYLKNYCKKLNIDYESLILT